MYSRMIYLWFLFQLFRTHMEHVERTKLFMSGDKIIDSGLSPRGRY